MGSIEVSGMLRLAQGCGWLTCVRRLGSSRSVVGAGQFLGALLPIQWLQVEVAMLHFQRAPGNGEAEVFTSCSKELKYCWGPLTSPML